jgi:hypothetical protein
MGHLAVEYRCFWGTVLSYACAGSAVIEPILAGWRQYANGITTKHVPAYINTIVAVKKRLARSLSRPLGSRQREHRIFDRISR